MAEERLHYRGAQRRCQDERARRRERERPLGHEERHQGGYGSLVDVREEVPGGEGRHRPFVYALSHALKLENRCRCAESRYYQSSENSYGASAQMRVALSSEKASRTASTVSQTGSPGVGRALRGGDILASAWDACSGMPASSRAFPKAARKSPISSTRARSRASVPVQTRPPDIPSRVSGSSPRPEATRSLNSP